MRTGARCAGGTQPKRATSGSVGDGEIAYQVFGEGPIDLIYSYGTLAGTIDWYAVQALGVQIRAGFHTGEVEPRGADVGGIAVHIGARGSACRTF